MLVTWVPVGLAAAVAALVVIAPATKTQWDNKALALLQKLLDLVGTAAVRTVLPTKGAQGFASRVLERVKKASEK
jgi:pentose-5-phosphate-3-epimerase